MLDFSATNISGSLSPTALSSFEQSIGTALPDEYRLFLLANNGCRFANDMLLTIPGPVQESLVRELYGLEAADVEMTIIGALGIYAGRIPSTILPIGEDIGSYPICLSLADKDYGAVYYWDLEGGHVGARPTANVYPLAPSFTAFLQGLQVYVEPPAPPQVPILEACEKGDLAAVKAYAAAGGDLLAENESRMSLLHIAVRWGQLSVVSWLVEQGVPITGAIIFAARGGDVEMARYLLDNGADVDERDDVFHATPLITATGKGDRASVELYLERGADVNAVSKQRRTALTEAICWEHYDIARLLLQHGANPNVDSPNGSPILMAAGAGTADLLDLLLAHGASLAGNGDAVDPILLSLAASGKNVENVRYLLERGANPKARTPIGTSLQIAKKTKNPEIIALIEVAIQRQ